MSEPSFFPSLDQSFQAKDNNNCDSPAVVMFNTTTEDCSANINDANKISCEAPIEFGFEVNVLDFIVNNQVNDDDEAIVSFGKQFVNSPESGIASSEIYQEPVGVDQSVVVQIEPEFENSEMIEEPEEQNNNNHNEAVKFPNYAQVVQYVAASWKKVEQELKQGLAQKY